MDASVLAVVDLVAAQGGAATGRDRHARQGVAGDVVVFQRAQPVVVDVDASVLAVVDLVAAQGRVAAGLDRHARRGVAGDVVVLQRAQPVVVDMDASVLAVVDLVAAQSRVRPVTDRDTGEALTADITALQVQAPLRDIHSEPVPLAAHLAQRQVRHPPDTRPEHQHSGAAGPDLDLGDRAIPYDLQRLVHHQAFLIQTRPHHNPVTRPRRLHRLAHRREITALPGIDYMCRRLGPGRHPASRASLLSWPDWSLSLLPALVQDANRDGTPAPEGVSHLGR